MAMSCRIPMAMSCRIPMAMSWRTPMVTHLTNFKYFSAELVTTLVEAVVVVVV